MHPQRLAGGLLRFLGRESARFQHGRKERSEAIEYLLPKSLAQKFANSEVTNQELLDKGQVLVNGVRIALNLQMVE